MPITLPFLTDLRFDHMWCYRLYRKYRSWRSKCELIKACKAMGLNGEEIAAFIARDAEQYVRKLYDEDQAK
jgi:hypothetical protein